MAALAAALFSSFDAVAGYDRHEVTGGTLAARSAMDNPGLVAGPFAKRRAAVLPAVRRHAGANAVPLELALAVIEIESGFNPRARGRAGEVGLMQIKPRTARGLGYRGSASGLYEADVNLRWGMIYLGRARQLAGGDICGTILRYNAGHGARRMNRVSRAYCGKVERILARR